MFEITIDNLKSQKNLYFHLFNQTKIYYITFLNINQNLKSKEQTKIQIISLSFNQQYVS